eukprot:TRINITY_DN718_c0_g1_i2.p1 TRINITY_DN718_c0_g1~~TRINITY_DN718_c0_g1_i2.p1  ORF type:complete len:881 (+),score=91.65 TRINITY_DN718_c0_g1_i2:685-3327(+)
MMSPRWKHSNDSETFGCLLFAVFNTSFRYRLRNVSLIAAGTKKDLLGNQNLTPEAVEILNTIKYQYQLEATMQCSSAMEFETGCLQLFNLIDASVVCPIVPICDIINRRYKPFVNEFLKRIFEFYDEDKDRFLNTEEFRACYNDANDVEVVQNVIQFIYAQIFTERPDLLPIDGKMSWAGFLYWFELPLRTLSVDFAWSMLRLFGFHSIHYAALYPPKLRLRGPSLAWIVKQSVIKTDRTISVLKDMYTFMFKYGADEEVKYWLACSFAGVTSAPESRDVIMEPKRVIGAVNLFAALLFSKNLLTARMAAMSISHFLEDKYHRPKFIPCKDLLTKRLSELLSMDLDPVLLATYSRPLVGLSNDEPVKEQLIDNGFVKVMPKLIQTDFADLQYNIGQVLYNLLRHSRRAEVLTEEMSDSILHLMKSPLPGLIDTGLECTAIVVELLPKRGDRFFNEIISFSTSDQYNFRYSATITLSFYTRDEKCLEMIIERKSYSAFIRMMNETPVINITRGALLQAYFSIENLLDSEKFLDVQGLFTAILTPMSVPNIHMSMIPNIIACLTSAAKKRAAAEQLIKVLENEINLRRTQPVCWQYLKVVERLAYEVVVYNPNMNLIDAGFITFIKNQLKAFKSTKVVIPLLNALGILATKQIMNEDEELKELFNELLNDKRLMDETDLKFVLEWCMGNVESKGVIDVVPPGVYLSDELKTKAIKISPDKLSARLDIETFETIAANVAVTKGKWYYEVKLYTDGIMQIGWATRKTLDKCMRPEGEGRVGDDFSYGVNLNENQAWHGGGKVYGSAKWKAGDVLGCYLDLDKGQILFSLNGVQQGVAFENVVASDGLFPAISMEPDQQVRFNFGSEPFAHEPIEDFKPYCRTVI